MQKTTYQKTAEENVEEEPRIKNETPTKIYSKTTIQHS
jgi:hypothetical protein